MKYLESLKVFLLLCIVLIAAYATYIYHSQRYEMISAQDRLYLIDKRTGHTYYPTNIKGETKWGKWVSGFE